MFAGFDNSTGGSFLRLDSMFMTDDVGVELRKQFVVNTTPMVPTEDVTKGYWHWLRSTYQERALEKFDAGLEELVNQFNLAHHYHPSASRSVH